MNYNMVVELISGFIGAVLIIYFGGGWLFLGIFLFMWSNNIMIVENIMKKIKDVFNKPRF